MTKMLKFLLCFCATVFGGRSKSPRKKKELVKILALLPDDDNYLFSQNRVRPAINYAIESIKSEPDFLNNFIFDVEYGDSQCSKSAMLTAVDMYYKNVQRNVTPSLILGPVCSYAAHGVNEFAKFWNIPMITSGAMAMAFTQEYQPTLTRITAPYTEIGEFFKTIMLQLNYWKHTIHLLYHSPEDLTKDCYFAMEAIDYVLKLQPDKFRVLDTVVQHPLCCINYEEVIKQMNEPKVVITCGSDDFVRSLMLAAKRMGLTDPKQNVWYTVDLFNASYFGHGSWQRGDQHDVDAYEAYKALQVLTLRTNIRNLKRLNGKPSKDDSEESGTFANFTATLAQEYLKTNLLYENQSLRVNSFVEGFHDSLILYAFAIDASIADKTDWRNGQMITEQMRMRQMNGIGSAVKIDDHGNRYGDYSLLAMVENNNQQYKFRTVYTDLRSRGIRNYENALMPIIHIPEIAEWQSDVNEEDSVEAKVSITTKSWWFYVGSIILLVVAVSVTIVGLIFCCRRISAKKQLPSLQHTLVERTHRPLQKELSTFSNSGNSTTRPNKNARRSTGSNPNDFQRGHCAVERTVTQITYCSDQDHSTNRDSGMVESG